MNLRIVTMFGPVLVVDDMDTLELLTDLLYIAGDYLNVVFAVASYVQRLPNGMSTLVPAVMDRLDRSIERLAGNGSNVVSFGSKRSLNTNTLAAYKAALLQN